MWMDFGWHMGWMFLWWVLGLACVGLFVWVLVRAATPTVREAESPELILKRRYAHGEIDRDEYERRLSDLRK
jgi:putative membrane protein